MVVSCVMPTTAARLAPLMRTPLPSDRIHAIRGRQVMLSNDLADLYGVAPKALVQAVTRNRSRFPHDFMFRLTAMEVKNLKSQNVTSSWGGSRRPPYAFTEQGVAMLSGVLRSARAIKVNVAIMRAFVRLRALTGQFAELARRIDDLEITYDGNFEALYRAIQRLIASEEESRRPRIGFHAEGALRPQARAHRSRRR